MSEDDYIEGAPELIAEIAASSAAIDLGDKKRGDMQRVLAVLQEGMKTVEYQAE